MPLGLSVVPSVLQHFINSLLFEFGREGVVANLDHIMIETSTAEENYTPTCHLIEKRLINNLESCLQKCKFF
jgi:hypothetical protein